MNPVGCSQGKTWRPVRKYMGGNSIDFNPFPHPSMWGHRCSPMNLSPHPYTVSLHLTSPPRRSVFGTPRLPWGIRHKQNVLCQEHLICTWHTGNIVLGLFMLYSLRHLLIYSWSDSYLLLTCIRSISKPLGGEGFDISSSDQYHISRDESNTCSSHSCIIYPHSIVSHLLLTFSIQLIWNQGPLNPSAKGCSWIAGCLLSWVMGS